MARVIDTDVVSFLLKGDTRAVRNLGRRLLNPRQFRPCLRLLGFLASTLNDKRDTTNYAYNNKEWQSKRNQDQSTMRWVMRQLKRSGTMGWPTRGKPDV